LIHKSQHRTKQQDKCSPPKSNSTAKDLHTCIQEEISYNEFQKMIVKMINDLKEETQNLVFDLKEVMNKQLNEFKENTNKQMNETKKTIQDMKEEINKDMETLKINPSNINNSIPKIKISIESLGIRVKQVEKGVSRTKTK
jgi:gas vesicle protein